MRATGPALADDDPITLRGQQIAVDLHRRVEGSSSTATLRDRPSLDIAPASEIRIPIG
jgi:hypothetical protein